MKISKIICPGCKNTEFKFENGTYVCKSCGYSLTDMDRERILTGSYEQHKAELNQQKGDTAVNKPCIHKFVLLQTAHCDSKVEDLFYCERCLQYEKRIRP